MKITLQEAVSDIISVTKEISRVIQLRFDEFENKFGTEEINQVFRTKFAPSPDEISFYEDKERILITWEEDIGRDYIEMMDYQFPVKYLDDAVWNEFLISYQDIIDKKIEEKKLVRRNRILSEIEYAENKLRKLKDHTEIDTTIKSVEQDLIRLKNKLNEEE